MRRLNMTIIYLAVLLISAPTFATQALSQHAVPSQVRALFDSCDNPKIPGGFAAAVIKDGKLVFKGAYGFADSENEVPFTTHTRANYASVAKQFTGYAVAMLVRDGKLNLDDDIKRYLPDLPDFRATITVRHLLYHTSGIRDWWGLVKISGRYMHDVITDDFMMKLVMNQKELNFQPGESFQYSNTGYFLLARIIANVTGESFPEWMEENVFRPLGMNDTHFSDDYSELIPYRARSYEKNESGEFQNSTNNMEIYGSSCLISTLDDMIKWGMNYETTDPGGRHVWNMMLVKGLLNNKDSIDYGFGISFSKKDGITSYGHGGSCNGFLSQISVYPEQRLMYILICNRDPSGVYLDDKLLNVFAAETLNREDGVEEEGLTQAAQVEIDPKLLKEYAGTYRFFSDNVVSFEKEDDHLIARLPWESVRLYGESQNKFFRKDFDAQFEFIKDEDGSVSAVVYWFKGAKNPPFRKLKAEVREAEEAAALCGDYYCPELRTSYRIVIENNHLILWHLHNEDVTLVQLDDDRYLGDRWWCEEVRMLRDQSDKVVGFTLDADRGNIQGLRFVKESR